MILHKIERESIEKLKIDCKKCSGLCCVAFYFSKIDGFPENKKAGKPCINLNNNFKCKIHQDLDALNMKGCIGYDCFGAGQHVTQLTYKGESWQAINHKSKEIFDVFIVMSQLFQIQFYLEEALLILPAKGLWDRINDLLIEKRMISYSNPQDIIQFNIDSYKSRVDIILKQVIATIKINHDESKPNYLGRNCEGKNMSGLDLSGNLLIAANFDRCQFNGTIFLGADTRDTDFKNADLSEAVFLTQGQINSAKGNRFTKLPEHLDYPKAWMNQ